MGWIGTYDKDHLKIYFQLVELKSKCKVDEGRSFLWRIFSGKV